MQFAKGEDELRAPFLLPVDVELIFWHLGKPSLNRIADICEPQARIDAWCARKDRKPVRDGRLQAAMHVQEKSVVERSLM